MIGEIGGNFWKNYDVWKKNWSIRILNIVSIVLSRRTFFFLDYPEDYYENFITSNYFMIGYRSVDFYV